MKCGTSRDHSDYGASREERDLTIEKISVSPDGMAADLVLEGLPPHVHELRLDGDRDRDSQPLPRLIGCTYLKSTNTAPRLSTLTRF